MIAVLLSVSLGGVYLGSAVLSRHRAQAAADLAALAAAGRVPAGADAACLQAASVTRAMRATTVGCRVDDLDVVVTVEVAPVFATWVATPAHAAARAGPIDIAPTR
jgi:secretion/DNA translocation related TadE-like protein